MSRPSEPRSEALSAPVVVGITAYAEPARWGDWDVPAVLLPERYVTSVVAAGGVPVLLPPQPGLVTQVVPRLDALVVAGGPDVDPSRYGAERGPHTATPREPRDAAEIDIVAAATASGVPILGVCRGMQVMNVARGGSLVQHLPDVVGHTGHAPGPGVYGRHTVRIQPGSRTAAALGSEKTDVPTYHHQGIDRLGDRLVVTGWTDDGTAEALEDPALPFFVGVQWHPEVGEDLTIFASLVEAARAVRAAGGQLP
jgi:putative glutamine amidotransferase